MATSDCHILFQRGVPEYDSVESLHGADLLCGSRTIKIPILLFIDVHSYEATS
jgi:hypothetical protein